MSFLDPLVEIFFGRDDKAPKNPKFFGYKGAELRAWCRKVVLRVAPWQGPEKELDELVSRLLGEILDQEETRETSTGMDGHSGLPTLREIFGDPRSAEEQLLRASTTLYWTWQARRELAAGPQPSTKRNPVSLLCLVLPARQHEILTPFQQRSQVSAAAWKSLAKAWTWYWSGSEAEFQQQGIIRIFEPGRPDAEDEEEGVRCLKIVLPALPLGLSMTASFGDRLAAISDLAAARAKVEDITEPLSLNSVLKFPFRQNR